MPMSERELIAGANNLQLPTRTRIIYVRKMTDKETLAAFVKNPMTRAELRSAAQARLEELEALR